jgi:signal transduction histidine kinase
MIVFQLAIIFVTVGVGIGVLRANPGRAINRAFSFLSATVAIWLMGLAWLTSPSNPNPIAWVRFTSAIGAFFPCFLWIIKNCAKGEPLNWRLIRRSWPWFLSGVVLAVDVYTWYFIPPESTPRHPLRGWGWNAYSIILGAEYLGLLILSVFDLRKVRGIQRVELQTLLLGGTAAGLFGVAFTTIGPLLGFHSLPRQLPALIAGFYAVTAWAITTQKVFDARHLFQAALRSIVSLGVIGFVLSLGIYLGLPLVSEPWVILICTILLAYIFQYMSQRNWWVTKFGGDRNTAATRGAILATSREALDPDVLESRFCEILNGWGRTEHTHILAGSLSGYSSGPLELPNGSLALRELIGTGGWATPERLERQRPTAARSELEQFMHKHRLGVMVAGPSGTGIHPIIIGQEIRHDRRPFVWPEVQLLQEWSSVIEGAFTRAALSQHARDAEQLVTAGLLGANLAHEIRNPLVTIKLIVQSAKDRFYEPDFRRLFIDIVPGELERIEGLVDGLLDLGRPRHPKFERLRLNDIVANSLKLVQSKADKEKVALSSSLLAKSDELSADNASLRQVILNLLMNAIEAVSSVDWAREVAIRTSDGKGSIVLEVADNGPGVPLDVRQRLFRPFTTSNKTSGIGLGLAITAEIVRSHHGQIVLLDDGRVGTTFRVTLPCQQPSS